MGQALVCAAIERDDIKLVAGTDRPDSPAIGAMAAHPESGAPLAFEITDDAEAALQRADVAIDFTAPKASITHAQIAAETKTPLVLGTTGLDEEGLQQIVSATRQTPILMAANFSLGVNLLLGLTRQAAAALGPDWDIEILETHHHHKVDAPSGTALALGKAAAAGRGVALEDVSERARDGIGDPRAQGAIGFAVMRGGDVAGEHMVSFFGQQERIELTHRATDRMIFARGAITAATWLAQRPPHPDGRLYGMDDVLGLTS